MGDVPSFSALTAADVDALVVGVSLLGSGGGGDAMTFARVLRHRLGTRSLVLHSPSDLAGDMVVPVGVVGATSVFLEKLPGGHELTGAVRAVSRWTGTDATAVMPLEAGGLNGVAGLVAALELDLPFLDADLMGRALPRLDQLTWSAHGTPLVPAALCEPGGQVVVIDGATPSALERTARAFLAQSGGWAAIALRPMPVPLAVKDAVRGSLAHALRLGHGHAGLPERAPAEAVAAALGGDVLGVGRVRQIARLHHPLPTGSSIHVDSSDTGEVLRIEAQNEYLLAFVDGRAVASTPDLVCVLDRRTCLPIAVDLLRSGDEVMVLVLPGPTWWREPHRLRHVDPTAFGLDHEPVLRAGTS
jgi:uncharacterized protein